MRFKLRLIACAALIAAYSAGVADAAVITDLPAISGPGIPTAPPTADVGAPNNDNYSGPGANNPNQIGFSGINITGFDPIDFVIRTENSGGTVEYFMNLGTAINQTGTAWQALRLELGTGVGGDFIRTTSPVAGVTGLDFDFPDTDPAVTSNDLPNVLHEADRIVFSGAVIAPDASATGQQLSFDIPDITGGGTTYDFTLRMQVVAVPEPSSFALLAGVFATAGAFTRRRRRGNANS